jgi:hypothetical protein
METMLKQALKDVSIAVAHDGEQALNILFWQDNVTLPHLIILDLTLMIRAKREPEKRAGRVHCAA